MATRIHELLSLVQAARVTIFHDVEFFREAEIAFSGTWLVWEALLYDFPLVGISRHGYTLTVPLPLISCQLGACAVFAVASVRPVFV